MQPQGGTESDPYALRMSRRNTDVHSPNVVVPESAHFSFEKACEILSLEMRVAPSDGRFRMDADAAADLINKNTAALQKYRCSCRGGRRDEVSDLHCRKETHSTILYTRTMSGRLVVNLNTSPEGNITNHRGDYPQW